MVQGKKLPFQKVGTQGPAVETGQRGDRRGGSRCGLCSGLSCLLMGSEGAPVGLLLFSQRSRGYSGQLRVGRVPRGPFLGGVGSFRKEKV